MNWFTESIGIIAAILGTFCWLPQVLKTWRTRDTKSLSLSTQYMLLATMLLWLVYGIAIGSFPLIGANIFSISSVGIITLVKLNNKRRGFEEAV